jgi:cytochrome c peroxidase
MGSVQDDLTALFCGRFGGDCSLDSMLDHALGAFKTPGLRDLGHSEPYFHNGSRPDLEEVIRFYARQSIQARAGDIRNPDRELLRIFIDGRDVPPLAAFLRSLNEDLKN